MHSNLMRLCANCSFQYLFLVMLVDVPLNDAYIKFAKQTASLACVVKTLKLDELFKGDLHL